MELDKKSLNQIKKGLEALEDVRSLSDASVSSIINRSAFHLQNAAKEIEKQSEIAFPAIESHLQKIFEMKIKKLLLEGERFRQVSISQDMKDVDVFCWERLMNALPFLGPLVGAIGFTDFLSVGFFDNSLLVEGSFGRQINAENRKEIYFLTKELLKREIVLTYEVIEENSQINLLLKLSLTSPELKYLCVEFKRDQNILLGLPSIFSKFQIDYEDFLSIEKSVVVEITEDLQLKKYGLVNHANFQKKTTCGFVHIAFLFRPLSIIIPKRGTLRSSYQINAYTGCESQNNDQEENSAKPFSFKTIDLFELLRN